MTAITMAFCMHRVFSLLHSVIVTSQASQYVFRKTEHLVNGSPALVALKCPACKEGGHFTAMFTDSRICPVLMEEHKPSYYRAYERMPGGPQMCPH